MTEKPEEPVGTPVTVPCPTCGQPSVFAPGNRYRPFCSQRCRQIDLGAWAAEEFRVPSDTPPDEAPFGDPKQLP
ncbi:DNA gyrase inhibitor YacG [Comamonas sp. NLF-1-9]|uniref:DNA gyrase inhibitor YacG n=1 Tax=Comamonas sp. NLF-1-9 TaxID=2853163 RepID=UPI001C44369E|nr:DNA gyrase inhibitor YacG [Comamonas sp. NLF-1-9]QXL85479.1 DNA gyrase inhibitor YacG [Comamonas sp. NLF-1-9]